MFRLVDFDTSTLRPDELNDFVRKIKTTINNINMNKNNVIYKNITINVCF